MPLNLKPSVYFFLLTLYDCMHLAGLDQIWILSDLWIHFLTLKIREFCLFNANSKIWQTQNSHFPAIFVIIFVVAKKWGQLFGYLHKEQWKKTLEWPWTTSSNGFVVNTLEIFTLIRCLSMYRAKCFVDKLPVSVRTISQLYIRVALPQDHYPTQEQMLIDIAHEMNRMKQFKDFCVQLKKVNIYQLP